MLVGDPKAFDRAFGNVMPSLVTQDNDQVTRVTMLLTCCKGAFFFFNAKGAQKANKLAFV